MNIKKMRKKFVFGLVFALALLAVFSSPVRANANNVTGWAWSSNVGWISFNSTNPPATAVSFGVNIGTDGNMIGHAWSSNIGWIDFDPVGPYPQVPNYSARVDILGNLANCGQRGLICGWVRACSVFQSGCSGVLNPDRGGWDGWILLGPNLRDGVQHGVRLERQGGISVFRGYAWGGEPVGWISFNCADGGNCALNPYRVETTYVLNAPPVVQSTTSTIDYCDELAPLNALDLTVVLSWVYFDADGDPQNQYRIQVSRNSNFAPVEFEKTVTSSATGFILHPALNLAAPFWNTTFHWRVSVHDGNQWSTSQASSFTVARTRRSPSVVFSRSPVQISVGEVVTFNGGSSQVFDGTTTLPHYAWTFSGGNPGSATSTSTATTTFTQPGNASTTLTVTDSGTPIRYSCSLTQPLSIRVPLPDWREVVPFGRARMMLASVMERIFRF